MKKILSILGAALLSFTTATVFAQDNPEQGPKGFPPENGKPGMEYRQRPCHENHMTPEQIAEEKASGLQKEFNLTDKQKEEARNIFLSEATAVQKARENIEKARIRMDSILRAQMKQGKTVMDSLKSKTENALGSVLTKEQMDKYKDFFNRFRPGAGAPDKRMVPPPPGDNCPPAKPDKPSGDGIPSN